MTEDTGRGRTSATRTWIRRSYAALLLVVGLALAGGGAVLSADAGSPYYLVAGLAVLASGILVWRDDRRGAWLYGAVLVGTLGWADHVRQGGGEL